MTKARKLLLCKLGMFFFIFSSILFFPVNVQAVRVLEPRTPPNGKWKLIDAWGRPEAFWTCHIIPIPAPGEDLDICSWEDIFPTGAPSHITPPLNSIWRCIPRDPASLAPPAKPFIKGECLFIAVGNVPAEAFEPSQEQLTAAQQRADEVIRTAAQIPTFAGTPPQSRLTNEQRKLLLTRAETVNKISPVVDVLVDACKLIRRTPRIGLLCEISGKIIDISNNAIAQQYRDLAKDPPDMNFTIIPTPTMISFTLPEPSSEVDPATEQIVRDLARVLGEMLGYHQAIRTALNRADGAIAAGAIEWERRQVQAADQYMREVAVKLKTYPDLLAAFQDALAKEGVQGFMSSEAILEYQNQFVAEPFPDGFIVELKRFGLDDRAIAEIRYSLITQNPISVTELGHGDITIALKDPTLRTALLELASTLEQGIPGVSRHIYMPLLKSS